MNDTGQPLTFGSNIYSTFTLLYFVTLQLYPVVKILKERIFFDKIPSFSPPEYVLTAKCAARCQVHTRVNIRVRYVFLTHMFDIVSVIDAICNTCIY